MLRHATALIMMLAVTGCGSSTTFVSPDQIAAFKTGSTNQTEVVAALGKPYHTIVEADGTKIDQYPYSEGASGGGGMFSMFGDSSPESYHMVSFSYGAGGVLKDIGGAK